MVRFDHPGESLLAAHHAGELVGVGGVTAEPLAGRYRMRRFYVRPAFRHRGIGGQQGLQSFTYTATDSQGASSAPTAVNVTVNGAWEAPTFVVNGEVDEKGQKAGPKM